MHVKWQTRLTRPPFLATLDETPLHKRQTHFECLWSSQVGGHCHFGLLHFWHPTPGGWCSGGPAPTAPLNLVPVALPASCSGAPCPFHWEPSHWASFYLTATGLEVDVPRATLQKMSETRECFIRICSSVANLGTCWFRKAVSECSLSVRKNMYFFSSKGTLVMARVAKHKKQSLWDTPQKMTLLWKFYVIFCTRETFLRSVPWKGFLLGGLKGNLIFYVAHQMQTDLTEGQRYPLRLID